jgi:choline dehydrogenase-like flavoprotein
MHKKIEEYSDKDIINFDVCIVGSGPAGISVALKLLKNKNIKFAILESGEIEPKAEYQKLNHGYSKGERKLDLISSRLRCFGGAGKLWAGVCRPMSSFDFKKRFFKYSGWPISYSDLDIYYKEAAKILGLDYDKFFNNDWKNKSRLAVIFNKFANKDGILKGVKYQRSKEKNRDLAKKYRKKLFESKNCTIITNATVTDLIQREMGGLVKSALVRSLTGKRISVEAEFFILCAGAIENPRILLDSSIDKGLRDNKFLGKCFMSHPAFVGTATMIKKKNSDECFEVESDRGLEGDFGFELNYSEQQKNNILRHNINFSIPTSSTAANNNNKIFYILDEFKKIKSFLNRVKCKIYNEEFSPKFWNVDVAIEQQPRIDNYIKLSDAKDALGNRKVEIYWSSVSSIERKTVIEATIGVGREAVITNTGVCQLSENTLNEKIFKQDDPINHHMGTTRMADTKQSGVVNKNLRYFGLDNLYISGSSVFSTSSIVNPTFTIIALSLRLGEFISNKFK